MFYFVPAFGIHIVQQSTLNKATSGPGKSGFNKRGFIKLALLSGVTYEVNLNSGPKKSGFINRGFINVALLTGGFIKRGLLYFVLIEIYIQYMD